MVAVGFGSQRLKGISHFHKSLDNFGQSLNRRGFNRRIVHQHTCRIFIFRAVKHVVSDKSVARSIGNRVFRRYIPIKIGISLVPDKLYKLCHYPIAIFSADLITAAARKPHNRGSNPDDTLDYIGKLLQIREIRVGA